MEGQDVLAQTVGGASVATHIRGTMIVNSLTTLRSMARIDDYFARLPAEHHGDVHGVTVQSWVPMELAVAHYTAMGQVFTEPAEQVRNGRVAAERTQNSHVKTLIRTLCATGTLDLWGVMARIPGLVARSVRGGHVLVRRLGPKDARLEFRGFPFFSVRYMHNSTQGTCQGVLELMTPRIFVRQDSSFRSEANMALVIAWV